MCSITNFCLNIKGYIYVNNFNDIVDCQLGTVAIYKYARFYFYDVFNTFWNYRFNQCLSVH